MNTAIPNDHDSAYAVDHMTDRDSAETPDTSVDLEGQERRAQHDYSFWGGKWAWQKSNNPTAEKESDKWYIVPTVTLIGQTAQNLPTVWHSCSLYLRTSGQEGYNEEYARILDFLRACPDHRLLNDVFGLINNYSTRFIQAAQRYLAKVDAYNSAKTNQRSTQEDILRAKEARAQAGKECRDYVGSLMAVEQAYHEIVTDPEAYQVSTSFDKIDADALIGRVRGALQQQGRQMTSSIRNGKMDARAYGIVLPWQSDEERNTLVSADDMLDDFA